VRRAFTVGASTAARRPGTLLAVPILVPPVAYTGPGARGRVTAATGVVLGLLGLLVWSTALALVPASGAAGAAVDRVGLMFEAQVDTARVLRHELLDARVIGMLVVVVGLALVLAGRPAVGGFRPARALVAAAVVLLVANAGWTALPGTSPVVTAASTGLGLVVALAAVRRWPHDRVADPAPRGLAAWPALLTAGFVLGLGYAPSDSPHIRPHVPEAHVLVVLGARELVLVAAVAAACAVGTRWVGARIAVGAVVVAVGTAAHLAAPHGLVPDAAAQVLVGSFCAVVPALLRAGGAAHRTARPRQVRGAVLAGAIGWCAPYALAVPGFLLGMRLQALTATTNDGAGPVTFGQGIVLGLVLVGVHHVVDRLDRAG
jgi:hypothetical protein